MIKPTVKSLFILVLFIVSEWSAQSQYKYPQKEWISSDPEKHGFSSAKLEAAYQYLIDSMKTTGLVVAVGGEIIFKFGSIDRISYLASCRKSILAMLYGKYVENGLIDLRKTVGELGFDDVGGLLPIEKTATVYDLITARSGVYHLGSNTGDDRTGFPPRGSQKPGTYFIYNNWDFNVAGAAFEKMTGRNIYDAFQTDIAEKIGLEDFNLSLQIKGYDSDTSISKYLSYHFYLSTRDMARIGYLMLRGGEWEGKQILSPVWHKRIISVVTPLQEMNPVSRRSGDFGYGYMWWVFQGKINTGVFKDAYTARGAMGQYITVLPALDMVVAHKTDEVYERTTTWQSYFKLLHLIIDSKY